MSFSTTRFPGESELKYIIRLGDAKESGLLDMTWSELADILNKELRDPSEYWTESAYRKKYSLLKQFRNEFNCNVDNGTAEELIEIRRELEKEKVKVRDERNEYRRLLREEARKESFLEQIQRTISESTNKIPLTYTPKQHDNPKSESALLIPLYDIHGGIVTKNWWNEYNEDILKERLDKYLDKIFEIKERHIANGAYVVISEAISGLIHNALRLEANQDVIDQFLMVMEHICYFIEQLRTQFNYVSVFVAPGNHSRLNPNKNEEVSHENLDNLIIPFLKGKFQNDDCVHLEENRYHHGTAIFRIGARLIMAVHGDKDPFATLGETMQRMFGDKPSIVLTGHKHTNRYDTQSGIKVVQTGCLSGMDTYAADNRLLGVAEQTVCVVTNKDGLDCIYDIKF